MASDPRAAKIKLPPTTTTRTLTFSGVDLSVLTEYSDKNTCEEFIRGKYYLAFDSKKGMRLQELGAEGDPGDLDFRKSHFPELSWVNETNNKGLRKIQGKEYLVYETDGNDPVKMRRLCVDPVTLYPVSFESFSETDLYTYSNAGVAAGQKIPMPAKLAEGWQKVKADTKRYFRQEIQE